MNWARSCVGLGLAAAVTMAAPSILRADVLRECGGPPVLSGRTILSTPDTVQANLSRARPGDTVQLRGGVYGPLTVRGPGGGWISVENAPGEQPVLSTLSVNGSYVRVRGLKVTGVFPAGAAPAAWPMHNWLVRLYGSSHVVIEGNAIGSTDGAFPWAEEHLGAADPTPASSGVIALNGSCVSIAKNHLYNVFNGIAVGGDQKDGRGRLFRVSENIIEDFSGDGIDHYGSDVEIINNTIINGHDICNNVCVHMDGIQGWTFNNDPSITNRNISIIGNIIEDRVGRTLLYPADSLQGITIFDGKWSNVVVENNVVVVDSWHGISLGGVDGLIVAYNTVEPSTARKTWIMVTSHTKQGAPSANVRIFGNVAADLKTPAGADSIVGLDLGVNLVGGDPQKLFVRFDPVGASYDPHLRLTALKGVPAVRDAAPPLDIEGRPRAGRINPGAYQDPR